VNNWVLYTRNYQMLRAQINMKWSEANGYRISQDKTKAMHICRIPENHPDSTIRLNGQILEVVNTHTHTHRIKTVKAKCSNRLKQWGDGSIKTSRGA
jgi:hypothetical protein